MAYKIWLFTHIVGVIAFLGTFLLAFVAKATAERSGQPVLIAFAFKMMNWSDRRIMPWTVVLIVTSGVKLAMMAGLPMLRTGWIFWAIVAFSASGLLFLLVAPLQNRIEHHAQSHSAESFNWSSYWSQAYRWNLWAALALCATLGALALMVFKPALSSL